MGRRSWLLLLATACGESGPPPVVAVPPAPLDVGPAPPEPPPPPVVVEPPPPAVTPAPTEQLLREWTPVTSCASFDYHPRGGLQSLWCHKPARLTFAFIEATTGGPIFQSGPHAGDLHLDTDNDFGHYHPDFVRWLVEKGAPSPRDSAARQATQTAYDRHLKPLARIFHYTLQKARSAPSCFANEKKLYGEAIAKKRLPKAYYERWFYFMNPFFCDAAGASSTFFSENGFDGGIDGNVTKSVIGFWLRRALDGTIDAFADGLAKVLTSYDPVLLEKPYRPPDKAAINAALSRGAAAASTCAKARVTIRVQPDGTVTGTTGSARAPVDPNARCIETAFRQTVPPFDGGEMRFPRTSGK